MSDTNLFYTDGATFNEEEFAPIREVLTRCGFTFFEAWIPESFGLANVVVEYPRCGFHHRVASTDTLESIIDLFAECNQDIGDLRRCAAIQEALGCDGPK